MAPRAGDRTPVVRQAGCLAVRGVDEALRVLLVTSRYTGEWIAAKGGIEPGESPEAAASREAYEEAGVRGSIAGRLGTFDYPRAHGVGRIETYIMEVSEELDDWPERHERRRRWFSVDDALAAVRRPEVLAMLRALQRQLPL